MSIPDYPETQSPVVGKGDPIYENTWDNVNIAIQEALQAFHTADGGHIFTSGSAGPCLFEMGYYTGNATDNYQITLSNSSLNVLFVLVVPGTDGGLNYIARSAEMPNGYGMNVAADQYSTTYSAVQFGSSSPMGPGYFRLGTASQTNASGTAYTFFVFGIPGSLPAGDLTFTPSWIQHGESIELDEESDGAPTRASKQILSRFLAEHAEGGDHPFALMQVGSYTGNGTTQVIPLEFTPECVMVWSIIQYRRAVLCFSSMPDGYSKTLGVMEALVERISFVENGFQLTSSNQNVNASDETYYFVAFGK